jgi:cell division septal protein FtsQ
MARRKTKERDSDPELTEQEIRRRRGYWKAGAKVSGWTFAFMLVLLAMAWVSWQAESFLKQDRRFTVALRTIDDSDDAIRITGVHNASKSRIMAVFERDRGRSLYSLNPEKRRLQLRGVDWVRDAMVRRVWPNRIEVEIFERSPVAFIRVADGATGDFNNPVKFQPMLIDAEGVLLPVQGTVPQTLPLLTGVRDDSDVESRRQQVDMMRRVLRALRQYKSKILEVDVSRPDDIRVTCAVDGQNFALILGHEQFLQRLEIFLKQHEIMRDQMDPRREYDLTNEGRILAIEPEPASRAAGK